MVHIYIEDATAIKTARTRIFKVRGQCTQLLLDKMKYDPYWYNASTSYEPLQILALTEKTALAQTEHQYPFSTVHGQECPIYSFSQNTLSNE